MHWIFTATPFWRRRVAVPGWQAFLLAAAAALLTLGGPCYPPPEGLNELAIAPDNALMASAARNWPESGPYLSRDGGLTWQSKPDANAGKAETAQGGNSVMTPGGDWYVIEGTNIVRDTNVGKEVVYDAGYLRDKANLVLQYRDTGAEALTKTPKSIIHDPGSGNVVVAMGWDGVVVIEPDGEKTRVAVDLYVPTDFSATARLRLMFTHAGFWVSALMVVVAFSAIAIIAPRCGIRELLAALASFAVGAGIAVVFIILTFVGILWLWQVGSILVGPLLLLLLLMPLILVPLFLFIRLKVLPVESSRRIGLALCLALLLAAGAIFVFPGFGAADIITDGLSGDITLDGFAAVLLAAVAIPAIILVIIGAIPYRPDGVKIGALLWPPCAAMLLIALIAALWMLYFIPGWVAEWTALVLTAGIAALAFAWPYRRHTGNNSAAELPG